MRGSVTARHRTSLIIGQRIHRSTGHWHAARLLYVERLLNRESRKILLLSDSKAAAPFQGNSWQSNALRTFGIEIRVVTIPDDIRARLIEAQVRQFL